MLHSRTFEQRDIRNRADGGRDIAKAGRVFAVYGNRLQLLAMDAADGRAFGRPVVSASGPGFELLRMGASFLSGDRPDDEFVAVHGGDAAEAALLRVGIF